MVEVISYVKIDFIVVTITIMLRQSLADSAGHFWCPTEFKNVANPYFENLKHLKNPGHLSLPKTSIYTKYFSGGGVIYKYNLVGEYIIKVITFSLAWITKLF